MRAQRLFLHTAVTLRARGANDRSCMAVRFCRTTSAGVSGGALHLVLLRVHTAAAALQVVQAVADAENAQLFDTSALLAHRRMWEMGARVRVRIARLVCSDLLNSVVLPNSLRVAFVAVFSGMSSMPCWHQD